MANTKLEVAFDVTDEVGSGEKLTQTAWVFLPDRPEQAEAVLLCLPGGTYDKRYWHLEVPGHPGYSFAEHLAGLGYVVVTLDHLGVGGSSDPQHSGTPGLLLLARGDAAVAAQLRQSLREGTLTPALPPLTAPLIGVGHSMGACLTTMVQSQAHAYDAIALLGYGVQVTNVREEKVSGPELESRMEQSESLLRQSSGVGPEVVFGIVPRDSLYAMFHGPDVPAEVIAADDAAQSRVPLRAAAEVVTPGYVEHYAATIDVPVFLGLGGAIDVSPDPHTELANYRAATDVTLFLVPGSGHCHNFAGERTALWDRIDAWVRSVRPAATLS